MIYVAFVSVFISAMALAAVVLIERSARAERTQLLDRIQAPDAHAAKVWSSPEIPRMPTEFDADQEFATLPDSLLSVPDDLNPIFFPEE